MKIGIIGSGSWATAIAKIVTDNKNKINWWFRNQNHIDVFKKRKHNPQYLESIYFNTKLLNLTTDINEVVKKSDLIICVIPSAYIGDVLQKLPKNSFDGKYILSAVKGIIPQKNWLLNDFFSNHFNVPLERYFSIMGPCHAEEVALEKLSYLTFSGTDAKTVKNIAQLFKTDYVNTIINNDILGVQYAAVLKNIYALGAGIAHGLKYGDNFMSVYNANCAKELGIFLQTIYKHYNLNNIHANFADSVYLGDLLVTSYSPYSRNREFGTLLGKGYSVRAAQLEMNMIAEGYNTSKCIFELNQNINAKIPIITNIYNIIWNNTEPEKGFAKIEKVLM